MTQSPLIIDVVSDVMCPWCYVGKRRLDTALANTPDVAVQVRWHPFQLDATLPPTGKDYRRYHEDKFGSAAEVDALRQRVADAGAQEGIAFDFDNVACAPNTLNAHRLIRWAGAVGVQHQLSERLFALLFVEGANLTDIDVLASAADACGMAYDRAKELLESDQDIETVQEEIAIAHKMGVNSVPCFILDNQYAVMGAQTPDVIAQAIRQAAAEKSEEAPYVEATPPGLS